MLTIKKLIIDDNDEPLTKDELTKLPYTLEQPTTLIEFNDAEYYGAAYAEGYKTYMAFNNNEPTEEIFLIKGDDNAHN